jgi:hypothetical protein
LVFLILSTWLLLEHLSVELADSLMPYACLVASQLVVGKWPMVMVCCFLFCFPAPCSFSVKLSCLLVTYSQLLLVYPLVIKHC